MIGYDGSTIANKSIELCNMHARMARQHCQARAWSHTLSNSDSAERIVQIIDIALGMENESLLPNNPNTRSVSTKTGARILNGGIISLCACQGT